MFEETIRHLLNEQNLYFSKETIGIKKEYLNKTKVCIKIY